MKTKTLFYYLQTDMVATKIRKQFFFFFGNTDGMKLACYPCKFIKTQETKKREYLRLKKLTKPFETTRNTYPLDCKLLQ